MRPRPYALFLASILGSGIFTGATHGQSASKPMPPALGELFGEGSSGWALLGGQFSVALDKGLGKPVLTTEKDSLILEKGPEKKPLIFAKGADERAQQVRLLLRLRTDLAPGVSADIYLARKDDKNPGLRFLLSATRGADNISCQVQQGGKALHDIDELRKKLDWEPQVSNGFTYYPRAYPLKTIHPGWEPNFRRRIEHDMAALPDVAEKWLDVRIDLQPGLVRFWLDNRLVAWKTGKDIPSTGYTRLMFSPGVQMAGFQTSPWKRHKGFEPVPLEGYANGHAFLGNTSLKPGSMVTSKPTLVEGIPFVFPAVNAEGKDHIDVGKSLYRQANQEGYIPSQDHRWIGSARRDPARIQLRLPNGHYDRLYLIAASSAAADHVPLVTAMFYRPAAGFAESFEAKVPLATATSSKARPLPVTLSDGRKVNLWLVEIPLDPGKLSAFADMDIVELELTKKVHQFRSYPDPFIYGWHQGGRPSAVHIYGLTLGEAPAGFDFSPDKFGHVWTAPEVPAYTATLVNHRDIPLEGKLVVQSRSYDGSEKHHLERSIKLPKDDVVKVQLSIPVKKNGYHDIIATWEVAGQRPWREKRSFVRLAPDMRSPRWTGKGALFGYWSYHGGHHTPKADHHINLMTAAGARTSIGLPNPKNPLALKHWAGVSAGAWEVSPQEWARREGYDPKEYAKYQKTVIDTYTKARAAVPADFRPDHVYFFPEPHVSTRLTEGNYPSYWNARAYQLTPAEKDNLRTFFVTAKCAAEAVRKTWPDLKVLIPWGDPLFAVPLLRAGFPKNLIDGSGLDNPGFERLPEMQLHQICLHRLYELRKEFARAGIANPQLQYCEGIFVPTEPGAVSPREQMDIYNRWALLSMAYGVKRFYSGWFCFDCGNYYGSEHYGGCGIQRRIPYCDPRPAYAAYATMTDKLDQAEFDGWLPTGSLNTYCLRFKGPRGPVYTLWTIRGKRPVTLTLKQGEIQATDAMNNTMVPVGHDARQKTVTVMTDPSPIYVTGGEIASVKVGTPDHSEARPAKNAKLVADLGDGTWAFSSKTDKVYENGTFAMQRFPGKFRAAIADDPVHGKVLCSSLKKQETVHELMPWYNILQPKKPITLPGAPSALGIWVEGNGDWGRVIYTLRDAKGEKWTSTGTQDQYNCDDVHSWSSFNFDGWRYVRFELPGHTGSDSFRKHGTTWWRSDKGDGIVDLPLTLENIIVEQRSHVLYVNDIQPAPSNEVCFGKLFVEYASPEDATEEAIRISKLRLPPPSGAAALPNPIAELTKEGVGPATAITKIEPPREGNDGTALHVYFKEVAGAARHFIWVAAYPDGRGAMNLTPQGAKSGALFGGLRPGVHFYFWVTYQDAKGKKSKPSAVMSTVPGK